MTAAVTISPDVVDLFRANPAVNLLPGDGTVRYFGPVFTPDEADRFLEGLLQTIPWQHDEAILFGKRIVTARKVAWYGDATYAYTYSGTTKHALAWTPELRSLKTVAEARSGASYNSCLLNLYHHGKEGMAWHSDDETTLVQHAAITSLSFGAERPFGFKHKRTGQTVSVTLEHGSLLVMEGETQTHWLHRLPPSTKITTPRVNLTFRRMKS